MLKSLRNNFITGIAVLFPAMVTIWFIKLIVSYLNSNFLEPLTKRFSPYTGDLFIEYIIKAMFLIMLVLIIALIGFGTRVLFVRNFFNYLERMFFRVPLAGKVYSATKDMSQAMLGQSKGIFRRVVLVEFPRKGTYAIGFVTSEGKGEVQDKTVEKVMNIFVPTTPNPTSGFLLLVPEESLINLDMTIEEGLKLVISGGVVPLPPRVSIKKKEAEGPPS